MTCEDRRDLMLLYVTDGLEPPERDELRAHLSSGCPTCAGALAEAQATVAQLPQALPRVPAPAAARDRLMQRVLVEKSSSQAAQSTAGEPRNTRGLGAWAAITSIAAMIAVITAVYYCVQANRTAQEYAVRVSDRDKEIARLQGVASASQDAVKMLEAADLKVVSLARSDPQPKARGRIIWDRDNGKWHVSVFDLKPLPPDKGYELWFITPDQRKIPAGVMQVDAGGHGSMIVPVPKDIGPIAVAAFTDEPAAGVQVPTGSVQLAGTVQ